MHQIKYETHLWWVSVSGSPSHPTTLSASPTELLVGQLTRLPFHSGYATVEDKTEITDLILRLNSIRTNDKLAIRQRSSMIWVAYGVLATRGAARRTMGVLDCESCIVFGPVFLQFTFLKVTTIINFEDFTRKSPKHATAKSRKISLL